MSKSKYNNKKVYVDDIQFDSKVEANYYIYLKIRKEKGEIKDFKMQVPFTLVEGFENPRTGKKIQAIKYKADFVVIHSDDKEEVIDIKGYPTPVAKLKRKLFENKYGKPLHWIVYVKKRGGWLSYEENERLKKEEKKSNHSPEESLKQSIKEMNKMRNGEIPKNTLDELHEVFEEKEADKK